MTGQGRKGFSFPSALSFAATHITILSMQMIDMSDCPHRPSYLLLAFFRVGLTDIVCISITLSSKRFLSTNTCRLDVTTNQQMEKMLVTSLAEVIDYARNQCLSNLISSSVNRSMRRTALTLARDERTGCIRSSNSSPVARSIQA